MLEADLCRRQGFLHRSRNSVHRKKAELASVHNNVPLHSCGHLQMVSLLFFKLEDGASSYIDMYSRDFGVRRGRVSFHFFMIFLATSTPFFWLLHVFLLNFRCSMPSGLPSGIDVVKYVVSYVPQRHFVNMAVRISLRADLAVLPWFLL